MRNMSFMLTTEQIRNRTKTVTRRLGWTFLKPGDLIQAIEKGQGLKKVKKLGVIRVVSARGDRLDCITRDDVVREGFPEISSHAFVRMFCRHNGCTPETWITRIEFSYVLSPETEP